MATYTLNFPNGNSQTYSSAGQLQAAATSMGGRAVSQGGGVYVFVPKK